MGKALPLPPPHMSEGWPPWALHPCYLRGGAVASFPDVLGKSY